MKDKQGEHLDHRIRQALSTLPDAPVRGTSFDAAALWEQLRPELTAQPAPPQRAAPRGWWWLAASVVGTLLGGWWWIAQTKQAALASPTHAAVQLIPQRTSLAEAEPAEQVSQHQNNQRPWVSRQRVDKPRVVDADKPDQRTATQRANQLVPPPVRELPSDVPVVAVVPDLPQVVTAMTSPVATATANTLPKRRFAVVHQNDLRAEADVRAKLERNDRFVRMGTSSSGTSSAPAADKSGLIISLD